MYNFLYGRCFASLYSLVMVCINIDVVLVYWIHCVRLAFILAKLDVVFWENVNITLASETIIFSKFLHIKSRICVF